MLKIKQLMNKVTEKSGGSSSDGLNAEGGGGGSGTIGDSSDPNGQVSAEGFLCPVCMTAFPSPEILAEHYSTEHCTTVDEVSNDPQNDTLLLDEQRKLDSNELLELLEDERSRVAEMHREVLTLKSELESRKGSMSSSRSSDVFGDINERGETPPNSQDARKHEQHDVVPALVEQTKKLTKELRERTTEFNELKSKAANLDLMLTSANAEVKEKTEKENALRDEIKSLSNEIQEVKTDQNLVRTELEASKSKALDAINAQEKSKEEIQYLQQKIENLNVDSKKKDERLQQQNSELETLRDQHSNLLNQVEVDEKTKVAIESYKNERDISSKNLLEARNEISELTSNFQKLKLELEKVEKDNSGLRAFLDEYKRKTEVESAENKNVLKQMEFQLKSSNEKIILKEEEIESLNSKRKIEEKKLLEVQDELKKTKDDYSLIKTELTTKIDVLCSQLRQEKENSLKIEGEKKGIKLEYEDFKASKKVEVESIRTKFDEESKKLDKANEEIAKYKNDVSRLEKERVEQMNEMKRILSKNEEGNRAYKEVKALNDSLSAKLITYQENVKTLEKKVNDLIEEKQKTTDEILKLNEIIKVKTEECSELEVRYKSLDKMHKTHAEKFETDMKKIMIEINKLNEEKRREKEEFEKIIKDVNASRDLMEKNIIRELTRTNKTILQLNVSFEQTFNNMLGKSKESDINVKLMKDDVVGDYKALLEDIEMNINAFEQFIQSVGTKQKNFLNEMQELEKKYRSSEEARALLAEHCLAVENDLEKHETTTIELRRKLEDSHAALQELGRENQSLQVEFAKVQGRKWTDDSSVTNCSTCSKEFSITNRKHHCRVCGNIFCHDCSSKTASIPSSKKPVRVCDACFNDLSQ